MLGTSILGRIFQHKFNFKQWFNSKLTFRTWIICLTTFFLLGIAFWKYGSIRGIFLQASGADPVAYWKLDEGQGTSVYTSTGTENGTLGAGASGPSWVKEDQCISGKCLFFDGTNDFVSMGDALTSSDSTLGSMSFWFKSTKTDAVQPQIMLYVHNALDTVEDGFGGGRELHVNLTTSKQVQFYIESWLGGTDLNIISPLPYDDNKWHHVTAVWDKNGTGLGYLYVDGNEVGTGSMATMTSYTLTGSVFLARPLVTDYRMFGGYIDEVKVYDYALSSDQVKTQFTSRGSVNGVSAQLGDDDMSRKLSNGLIGYWKMDEGVGTTTADVSGNNVLGTFGPGTSAPTWTTGKFGNALDFDGSSDYVETNSSTSVVTGAFTMAGWVYFDQEKNYQGVFGKFTDCAGNLDIAIDFCIGAGASGAMWATVTNSDGSISVQSTITENYAGEWLHLAMVWDGVSTLKFYKNGILRDTDSTALTLSTEHPVRMGTKTTNGRDIDGKIDEVRLYNRVLESSEIEDLYNFAPGPVGYYDMNEKTGTTVNDKSGNGYTGSFGTGSSAPRWSAGKYSSSLYFDGSSDQVNVTGLYNSPQSFTLSGWINQEVGDRGGDYISLGDNVLLRTSGSSISGIYRYNSFWNFTTYINVGLTGSGWNHISFTHDSSTNTQKIYFNGVGVTSSSFSQPVVYDQGSNTSIGKHGNAGSAFYDFEGFIDDVRVYNYARTPAQIIEDMNAGHPAPGSPVGSALAYFRLDEGYGTIINNVGNAGSTLNGSFTGSSSPSWTTNGKFGKGLSFDGTDDSFTVADNDAFNFSQYTVSTWINPSKLPSATMIHSLINQWGGGGAGLASWIIDLHNTGVIRISNHDGTNTCTVSGTKIIPINEWSHIVATYSGGTSGTNANIYINGKLDTSGTLTCTTQNSSYPMRVGRPQVSGGTSENYKGLMDEIKIYSFAITSDQVKAEYNQGKALVLGAGSTGIGGTSPSNSGSREYCVPGDSSTCNAPVGEWLLNQGIGATFYDTSGNGLNGSFGAGISAPNWTDGKYESGLKFDGAGMYTYIADDSNIDASSTFSVSVWVKTLATSGRILSKHNENITNGWSMGIGASGNAYWDVTGPSHQVVNGVTSINDGNWHLISATLNGTDQRIYIDGKLDASRTYSGTPVTNNLTLDFGRILANSVSTDFFVGSIDSVRIYQYVRTPAQIAWEYNQGKPIAWYRLDECTGSTAYNAAKNSIGQLVGNNGTITIGGSGTQTSTGTCSSGTSTQAWNNGTTGKFNSSLNFDGTDDYISLGTSSVLGPTTDFSVSAWINHDGMDANRTIYSAGSTDNNYWYVNLTSTDELAFTEDGTLGVTSPFQIPANEWHYVTVVKEGDAGNNIKFYVDGFSKGTAATDSVLASGTKSIGIRLEASNNGFRGRIDELKLFNFPLTIDQIRTNMAGGAVRFQ